MERFLWICLGGAVGSGARYLVAGWVQTRVQEWLGHGFPYGTFAVNLLGSFLLGVLMQVGMTVESMSPTLRMALSIGVMGGFTTYSTFSYETMRLLQDSAWLLAFTNIALTVLICLGACFLGVAAARAIVGS